MDLFELAVAKKLAGGGGGGGGSSDFTTATVTMTLGGNWDEYLEFQMPSFYEIGEYEEGYPALALAYMDAILKNQTMSYPIVLYKGAAILFFMANIKNASTISGNCYFPEGYSNMLIVTGDCSISIQ